MRRRVAHAAKRALGRRFSSGRRRALAFGLGCGCAACGVGGAARARLLDYELAASEIAPGSWAVFGATEWFDGANGGNIVNAAFVEVPDGVVVVDTGPSRRYGEAFRALIERTVPGKPVLRVYNTHHHPDHCFGNQAFDPASLASSPGVIANIESEGDALADNMYRLLGDWMRGTAPVAPTVALESASEEVGGRRFSLHYLAGHTSADLVVRDDETGVLYAGDLAFLHRAPTTPHADLPDWRDALDTLAGIDRETILPGHGPSDERGESLEQTADWLDWLETTLREAVAAGLTMNEAMLLPIPERFASLGVARTELERSVVHLYPVLEDALFPRVDVSGG